LRRYSTEVKEGVWADVEAESWFCGGLWLASTWKVNEASKMVVRIKLKNVSSG